MLDRFYQIVDGSHWLESFLPLGLKLVQLRIKDLPEADVRSEISTSVHLCKEAGATLVVNDFWEQAIDLGADYVHLGQEDLADADLAALRRAGIKLGISTHSDEELDIALSATPDYVALGPIYPTILKKMTWAPQGLEKIGIWKQRVSCPLIAIGGITLERAPGVFAAGADSICVVTDVLRHAAPGQRLSDWLDQRSVWKN
ncbi:MAG: thiamine phosphate synthase [Stappiaceae bacterium]